MNYHTECTPKRCVHGHIEFCPNARQVPVDELAARRFNTGSDKPRETKIADMIAAATKYILENNPDHVIIAIGRTDEEGASGTKFFQAGKYAHHGQMGLMMEAALMMRES